MHATCHKPHANRRLKCAPSTHTHTTSMRRKNAQTVSMQLNDWRAHLPTTPLQPPSPTTSARRGAKPLESFLRLLLEPSYYYCSCCCDRRRRRRGRRRRAICYTLFSLDAFPFSGIFLNIYYSSPRVPGWRNWAMRKYHTKHRRETRVKTVKYWGTNGNILPPPTSPPLLPSYSNLHCRI